jgi:hypothetical protein
VSPQIVLNALGATAGEAFIEFESVQDAVSAMAKNKAYLG